MAKKRAMSKKVAELFKRVPEKAFYEMLVVFKPHLPDPVRKSLEEKVEGILEKYDASVKAKAIWGKRVMAYKTKGNKEGYYIMYYFEGPVENVERIRREIGRIPELLRYLVLRLEEMSLENLKLLAKKAIVME